MLAVGSAVAVRSMLKEEDEGAEWRCTAAVADGTAVGSDAAVEQA